MIEPTPADTANPIETTAKPEPPARIDLTRTAFFFDFDGTLTEIVEDPHAVVVEPRIRSALQALQENAGGAVALISGRSIEQLDDMLHPLRLPAAGVHGLERRNRDGRVFRVEIDQEAAANLQNAVAEFVAEHPGLLAEVKPGSVALHYRKRPDVESASHALAANLASNDNRLRVVFGKMVVEIKLAGRTKADAISDFMAEPPFLGRRPLFAGDDITDEDGFAAVQNWNGMSIKIGDGETHATHRLRDVAAFHDWLVKLSAGSPR